MRKLLCPVCNERRLSELDREETGRIAGDNVDIVKYYVRQQCTACGFVNHTTASEHEKHDQDWESVDESDNFRSSPTRHGA